MKTVQMGTYKAAELMKPRRDKGGRFTSFKARVRRAWAVFVFWVKVCVFISVVAGIGLAVGAVYFSSHTVEAISQTVEAPSPILDRIGDCESGAGHKGGAHQFNKNGSIVEHLNSNGSLDVGKYQINLNPSNVREMAALGLNPFTEAGNTAFAKWLYQNVGTSPWSSSAKCWLR